MGYAMYGTPEYVYMTFFFVFRSVTSDCFTNAVVKCVNRRWISEKLGTPSISASFQHFCLNVPSYTLWIFSRFCECLMFSMSVYLYLGYDNDRRYNCCNTRAVQVLVSPTTCCWTVEGIWCSHAEKKKHANSTLIRLLVHRTQGINLINCDNATHSIKLTERGYTGWTLCLDY